MVFDSRSKNALIVIRSYFFDAVVGNPFSKKRCNIVWVDGENGSLNDLAIDGL